MPMSAMVSKRILVTGGAGFLGSHLCERLVAEGHEVLCVDNFFTGRRANVAHLLDAPGFELMRHDVTFPLYVEVDEIYNLACPASPIHYQFDPVQTTKTRCTARSTCSGSPSGCGRRCCRPRPREVYGDPSVHPQTEDYWGNVNPIGPRSCYDEGKRCAETLCFDYHRQHGLRIKVVRIFNTYGPRMHPNDGRVVSNFIVQALQGEPLTIYGDGSQTRSFCYVDDLIEGFLRMMASPDEVTGPVNIGNPGEFTILRARREGAGAHRLGLGDRAAAAARERPDAAAARHQPREGAARLGADDPARGGAADRRSPISRRCWRGGRTLPPERQPGPAVPAERHAQRLAEAPRARGVGPERPAEPGPGRGRVAALPEAAVGDVAGTGARAARGGGRRRRGCARRGGCARRAWRQRRG